MDELSKLKDLYSNLRKSINNYITNETLTKKAELAKTLHSEIEQDLEINYNKYSDTEFNSLVKSTRNLYFEIQEIIELKLLQNRIKENPKTNTRQDTMTQQQAAVFDVKLAASVLTPFDGDSEKLSAFVDGVKFLQTVMQNEHHPTLKIFLLTRISGKARDALPNDNVDRSIDEMITLIKNTCESKATPEQIMAKLRGVKRGMTKEQYCQEVETLCNKLANAYVKENVPYTTARKLATRVGLETLINIVPTEKAQTVLHAGTFDTIEQAIQKINELPNQNENMDIVNRVFNVNRNQARFQNQGPRRGNWKRGTNNYGNQLPNRGFQSTNQRFGTYYNQRPNTYNGNYRGARNDYRGQHRRPQVNRIYRAEDQSSQPAQHINYNQVQDRPDQYTTAQPFLETVGQYTQSM